MLLSLSILGIVLSVILLHFNAGRSASSIYLGAFFFLVSLYGFIQYAVLYSKSIVLVSIIFINIGFLSYLTGPVLYLYFRSILTDTFRLKRKDLWHLLPMFIFLAGTINYIFTPWSYKIEVASHLVENPNYIGAVDHVALYQVIPRNLVYISRPLLIFIYALWSLISLLRFRRQNIQMNVFAPQKYIIKWLMVLLGFLFLLLISHLLLLTETFALRDSEHFFTLNLMQILSAVGLTGLLISIFFFPGILYGLPQFPADAQNHKANPTLNSVSEKHLKSKPAFEADYMLTIQQKADACMEEFQSFLQSDCNIAAFARLTKIPSHHYSYFFREIKKQSFNDYRNEWRIKHAKKLILEGKSSEMSMEGIGLLSGFSSRNAFYTAFKKAEGISPGVFASHIISSHNQSKAGVRTKPPAFPGHYFSE